MTGNVVWEDLPPDGRGDRGDSGWKIELKEHPGRWARLRLNPANCSNHRLRNPDYEFVSRTVDGKRVLYGRYVGNGEVAS